MANRVQKQKSLGSKQKLTATIKSIVIGTSKIWIIIAIAKQLKKRAEVLDESSIPNLAFSVKGGDAMDQSTKNQSKLKQSLQEARAKKGPTSNIGSEDESDDGHVKLPPVRGAT